MKTRRTSPPLHEAPGFLHALRIAREMFPRVPREAWIAAARSRDASRAKALARGLQLTPSHVADAAFRAMREGVARTLGAA